MLITPRSWVRSPYWLLCTFWVSKLRVTCMWIVKGATELCWVNCRNSSVGRVLDWRSKGPWFDPGFRHLYLFFLYALASRNLSTALFVGLNGVCYAAPLKVSNVLLFHLTFWHQCYIKVACHCYMTVGCHKTRLHEVWTAAFLDPQKNVFLGNAGIDPTTYSMLSKHNTNWSNSPAVWNCHKEQPRVSSLVRLCCWWTC